MDDNNIIYTTKLESLLDLAQLLGQQNDYEEVLRLVAEKASNLVNFRCFINYDGCQSKNTGYN